MDRYHVQLEWIGGAPGPAGLAAATAAAREIDPDAPTLGPAGLDAKDTDAALREGFGVVAAMIDGWHRAVVEHKEKT